MPLYKLIRRNAISDSEILPYQQLDVRLLYPGYGLTAEAGGLSEGSDVVGGADLDGELIPVSTITPLVLLIAAQMQAEEITTRARGEAVTLQQEAYKHGVDLGREEGKEESKKELHSTLTAFAHIQQNLVRLEEQALSRFIPEIVRLALAISEKLVAAKIAEDPQVTASVLERARAEISAARQVGIWLHPADYEVLQEVRPDLVKVGEEGGRRVTVSTAEEISRGGCRIETEMGVVDATLPVQLEEIRNHLLDEV